MSDLPDALTAGNAVVSTECGTPEEIEYLRVLADENPNWTYCGMIGDTGDFFAVNRFMYTAGIIRGPVRDRGNYEDRWCYEHTVLAIAAVEEWRGRGFADEPTGWHRHPISGRRRPEGDASREYVCR